MDACFGDRLSEPRAMAKTYRRRPFGSQRRALNWAQGISSPARADVHVRDSALAALGASCYLVSAVRQWNRALSGEFLGAAVGHLAAAVSGGYACHGS